ncbi:hypothetical protein [Streptomyces sp. NRRL F-5727]|uniref:hypothetical protein n=1 Tax=Streptomyces sp. NRRL F-5727 TaxID=1463871 RepID=UPI00068F4FA3|nr:hypothetical protein [Streptomyces sp. NRRL F-5727]
MSEFFDAAFGFPAMVLSAALVTVVGFWALVLCRVVAHDAFDADLDMAALGCGGLPAAVAGSAFVTVGWVLDIPATVLLDRADLPGLWFLLLSVVLLAGALTLSWRLTTWLAGRVRKRSAAGHRARRHGTAPGPPSTRPAA